MSKRQWLMLLGLLIMALPFIGLPSSWDTYISVAAGFLIIMVAYRVQPARRAKASDESVSLPYTEHRMITREGSESNNEELASK